MIEIKRFEANLDQLKPTQKNPRQISKADFEILKKSLQDFPEMRELREIVVDEEMRILGGHQRVKALKAIGESTVPIKQVFGLTEEQKDEFIIKDNIANGEWDTDILANEWDDERLEEWGLDIPNKKTYEDGSLARDFMVVPSTILDSRTGSWQDRKRTWKTRIKSENGRGTNLLGFSGLLSNGKGGYTSIFDPVLCEILYKWFGIPNGTVLDPFAGGSVRGIVAGWLGLDYFGNDLSKEQIEENRRQAEANIDILEKIPTWNCGDSANISEIIAKESKNKEFDLILSCPPYSDLEVYSDDPRDISNMSYEKFMEIYRDIIKQSVAHLKDNRFAVFVVGEIRGKDGGFKHFVSDTVKAFEDAGMKYYNHALLINDSNVGMRVRQHMRTRKLVHAHQDALVFTKGNPDSSEFEKIDEAAVVKMMQEQRKLIPEHEEVLVFTNAQSNEALKENFEEIRQVKEIGGEE